ncbi:MAG: glycine betaine/L-proline ABC transporter ATP-binding protein [Hormoscilla sp. GUM202]|nr:glycine betaine/L-proline ABC transporter ATP-binding protein [Hormoscilla sp. GUM202]
MKSSKQKIIIENLIKIYGNNPRKALKMFRDGATKDYILERTGNVVGVADVSLEIGEGELFVVMGLSGSGKSTLVRCINSLIPATSGNIYIDGEDIVHVSDERMRELRRTQVTMVFQRFGLFPHKTVAENVAYGLKVRGVEKKQRRQKALETLEVVGLAQWADYHPSKLSGGMQQRVGLARALATDAPILLMDEAFSALDPLIRREMQDELIRLQQELHKTIVFISHDIQEALKLADRLAVMKDGYVVQLGTPEEIINNPADDYIRAFIQDVNRASVIKVGAIARNPNSFMLESKLVKAAMIEMSAEDREQKYVLDGDGKPVGLVTAARLAKALEVGENDIAKAMARDFPKVDKTTKLEEIFPLCQGGEAIAVVDGKGKLAGVVEQSDVFANMVN